MHNRNIQIRIPSELLFYVLAHEWLQGYFFAQKQGYTSIVPHSDKTSAGMFFYAMPISMFTACSHSSIAPFFPFVYNIGVG